MAEQAFAIAEAVKKVCAADRERDDKIGAAYLAEVAAAEQEREDYRIASKEAERRQDVSLSIAQAQTDQLRRIANAAEALVAIMRERR